MENKFKNVPVEEDTRILSQKVVQLNGIDALYQSWAWDGIRASSLIFSEEDVSTMENDAILDMVKASSFPSESTAYTFKRMECGFVFVNFDFIY